MTREEAIAFFKDMNECTYGNLEAVEMAIKALDQEPRWIPVSERMPEPRIDVWCNSDMGQMVGYYDEYAETWYGRDYFELIVTAWMPLPEPYREENESEECRDCHYNDGEPHAECVLCTKDVAKEEPTIDEVIAEINKQE